MKNPAAPSVARRPASRRPRGSLSSEEIFSAAYELLQRDGLPALTMTRIAAELGAPVTSVYWYYRTKDDLVDALAEHVTAMVFAKVFVSDDRKPWPEQLFDHFVAYHDAMVEHPAFLSLFASRAHGIFASEAVGELLTGVLEHALTIICTSGVDVDRALRIYTTCSSYTRGFATLDVAFRNEPNADTADAGSRRRQRGLDPDRYPTTSRLSDATTIMNYDAEQFRFGLNCLIDGIAANLPKN